MVLPPAALRIPSSALVCFVKGRHSDECPTIQKLKFSDGADGAACTNSKSRLHIIVLQAYAMGISILLSISMRSKRLSPLDSD